MDKVKAFELIEAHLKKCDSYLLNYGSLANNAQIGQVLLAKSEALKAMSNLFNENE